MGSELEQSTSELAMSTLPRKASSQMSRCPYRKPPQVGEENILRRARKPSLRNSANSPRNFGIRGTRIGDGSMPP